MQKKKKWKTKTGIKKSEGQKAVTNMAESNLTISKSL